VSFENAAKIEAQALKLGGAPRVAKSKQWLSSVSGVSPISLLV
jgi:hypothetical protein